MTVAVDVETRPPPLTDQTFTPHRDKTSTLTGQTITPHRDQTSTLIDQTFTPHRDQTSTLTATRPSPLTETSLHPHRRDLHPSQTGDLHPSQSRPPPFKEQTSTTNRADLHPSQRADSSGQGCTGHLAYRASSRGQRRWRMSSPLLGPDPSPQEGSGSQEPPLSRLEVRSSSFSVSVMAARPCL
ncbi:unnamed protein product [Boreogadus saida]